MALNTAVSIVDFLKSRGLRPQQGEKFPLFETRKKLFEQVGLNQQLGDFRGTGEQNTALLNQLTTREKNVGVSITPENLFDIISAGKPPIASPTSILGPTEPIPATIEEPTTKSTIISQTIPPTKPPTFELPPLPTEEELAQGALERVQRGVTFPLREEEAEAEKAALQLAGQQKKESFIKTIASRGLFFSGAKQAGVSQIEADTLAKQLNIDRKFALLIATGLQGAAQDIVKEAQKGRQEAIDSLEALGFAINPLTGTVEPTLAARKAESTEALALERETRLTEQFAEKEERISAQFEEREERMQSQFEAQQALANARLELQIASSAEQVRLAQERINISEENLRLAQQREERLTEEKGRFSTSQINSGAQTAEISIDDFGRLDETSQNYFINNKREVEDNKENIKFLLEEQVNPSDIEGFISALDIPESVKDTLTRELKGRQTELERLKVAKFKKPKGAKEAVEKLKEK